MKTIDLHTHTTASDGKLSSKGLIDLAIERKVSTIAITDHDTIEGIEEAINYSADKDIEVIPGIEIRCNEHQKGFYEIDILGLFIDYKNQALIEFTKNAKIERIKQKKQIINKLNKLGFKITFDEVLKEVKGSFGRPHIAKVLIKKYPQSFSSINEVFDKYLGINKLAYVKREETTSIKSAIHIIKKSGGVPVLAHPHLYGRENSLRLIQLFKQLGGLGIETYYPYHLVCKDIYLDEKQNQEIINFYKEIASSSKFIESGGTDFHGDSRDLLGRFNIPVEILDKIKDKFNKK